MSVSEPVRISNHSVSIKATKRLYSAFTITSEEFFFVNNTVSRDTPAN